MQVSGELRQWHNITLDFAGPSVTETASTFRDHRLDVTFVNTTTGTVMGVPGYFAADGDALRIALGRRPRLLSLVL